MSPIEAQYAKMCEKVKMLEDKLLTYQREYGPVPNRKAEVLSLCGGNIENAKAAYAWVIDDSHKDS